MINSNGYNTYKKHKKKSIQIPKIFGPVCLNRQTEKKMKISPKKFKNQNLYSHHLEYKVIRNWVLRRKKSYNYFFHFYRIVGDAQLGGTTRNMEITISPQKDHS
jgi:hypothetical protein